MRIHVLEYYNSIYYCYVFVGSRTSSTQTIQTNDAYCCIVLCRGWYSDVIGAAVLHCACAQCGISWLPIDVYLLVAITSCSLSSHGALLLVALFKSIKTLGC